MWSWPTASSAEAVADVAAVCAVLAVFVAVRFEVLAAGVAGERVDRFAIESVRMSVPPVQAAFV